MPTAFPENIGAPVSHGTRKSVETLAHGKDEPEDTAAPV